MGPGANAAVLQYFNQFPHANTGGGDNLNTAGYTFSSPSPSTLNTSILKFDYNFRDKHHLFIRGNLQKDTTADPEQYPGLPPNSIRIDNTKGMAAGDTWMISNTLINDLRYGYIRQGYSDAGTLTKDYVDFRFMDDLDPHTGTTTVNVPVHNIIDNLSWTHGNHTVQGGVNWRLIGNNRSTNANSFNIASTNPYWIGSTVPDPGDIGLAPVGSGFSNNYLIAYANLVGTVPELHQLLQLHRQCRWPERQPVARRCCHSARISRQRIRMVSSGHLAPAVQSHLDLWPAPHHPADPVRHPRPAGIARRRCRKVVQAARDLGAAGPGL